MKYEIENYWNGSNSLMDEADLIEAETGRKALDKFLKANNIKEKVKISGSNEVHFKVTPIYVDEHGKRWIDRRGGKRALWYQVQQ
jgi:hypothetical protein